MKKKLSSTAGFTLTELLTVTVVIALIGLAVAAGVNVAARSYATVSATAEAQSLCDTLAAELTDELRFAHSVSAASSDEVRIDSRRYGRSCEISCNADGYLSIGGAQILGNKSYMGMKAEVAVVHEDGALYVTLSIVQDEIQRANAQFCVRPLCGIE